MPFAEDCFGREPGSQNRRPKAANGRLFGGSETVLRVVRTGCFSTRTEPPLAGAAATKLNHSTTCRQMDIKIVGAMEKSISSPFGLQVVYYTCSV